MEPARSLDICYCRELHRDGAVGSEIMPGRAQVCSRASGHNLDK